MSSSWHLNRASNEEFSVECLFWLFQPTWKSWSSLFELKYLECALNCKTQLQLKKITITNIWHSTQILTFDALSKWLEPDNQSFFRDFTTFMSSIIRNKHVFLLSVEHVFLCMFVFASSNRSKTGFQASCLSGHSHCAMLQCSRTFKSFEIITLSLWPKSTILSKNQFFFNSMLQ